MLAMLLGPKSPATVTISSLFKGITLCTYKGSFPSRKNTQKVRSFKTIVHFFPNLVRKQTDIETVSETLKCTSP